MAYRDYIEALRSEFVGKRVMYEGKVYTIAMVDYNGIIHIDKPSQYNETTAVYEAYEARKALILFSPAPEVTRAERKYHL